MEKVEKARKVLEDNGFQVQNLWHIEDVKQMYECTDQEAQEILHKVLTNEAVMELIWYGVKDLCEYKKLKKVDDDNK